MTWSYILTQKSLVGNQVALIKMKTILYAMIDTKKLWVDALGLIEVNISKANFGTWFRNTCILKQDGGVVCLGVPNAFAKDWLANKFHKLIVKTLRDLSPEVRGIEYLIQKPEEKDKTNQTDYYDKPPFTNQLNLNDLYVNKEDNLNPKYVFDTFIVGSFNELAYAAAQAVIKQPGSTYNPLFIYGPTGLGKTHLIQAVGNHFKKTHPNKKGYYITSERFSLDYVNSVLNNRIPSFKEKYRKYDILILDDVQFLSNKDKTQEELFHIFNNFQDNNKQLIFSSDKAPKHIPNLEERVRSRLEGGMMIGVNKPEFETRLAILTAKLQSIKFELDQEILEYIASSVQDNIRELEGALNSVVCQAYVKKRGITLNEAKALLKNSIKPKKSISVKSLTSVVAEFYNIEEQVLYEKTRKKEVVKPRQVVMYLLREDFSSSYPYIGQKLGGRDHTTVIHAYDKIRNDLKNDANLVQEIEQIRGRLYSE